MAQRYVTMTLADGAQPLLLPREHAFYHAVIRGVPGMPDRAMVVLDGSQHLVAHSPEEARRMLGGEEQGERVTG